MKKWFIPLLAALLAVSACGVLSGETREEKAARDGLELQISFQDVFPATVSHAANNEKLRRCCRELGPSCVEMPAPFRSSEDFGWYTKRIPGAFFEIGGGPGTDLHTVDMDFNDEIIPIAAALYRRLIDTD